MQGQGHDTDEEKIEEGNEKKPKIIIILINIFNKEAQ
jgi:hypothetical protein